MKSELMAGLLACACALPPTVSSADLSQEQVDPRTRTYVQPVRVVAVFDGTLYGRRRSVQRAESLLGEKAGQVPERGSSKKPEGCLLENNGEAPGVLLDFGRELHGGVQIGTSWNVLRGSKVRVRFGESVSEACCELTGDGKRGTNDHAIRDAEYLIPGEGTLTVGDTGFRFVRIDLVTPGRAEIEFVRAVSVMRPMTRRGTFASSDERLNRVFDTAVRTVHLCCQDFLWDGIKRDRLVWMGDTHPETMAILNVFGAADVLPRTFDFAMKTTDPDTEWMNHMSPYSLWFIRNIAEWYRFTGDVAYVRRHADYLRRTLRHLLTVMNEKGEWACSDRPFLDWPSQHDKIATMAGLQGLAAMAFRDGAELMEAAGDAAAAATSRAAVAKLAKLRPDAHGSKQAAAVLALAGLRDPKEMYAEVLGRNGHDGVSTFYGYYMLEAMSAAGENRRALDTVRDFWGAMLDVGATSFWENFDLAWTNNCYRLDQMPVAGKKDVHGDYGEFCYPSFRHSLCHGWSAGPAAWCINHVLGIRILEPGCRAVEVKPFLGDLAWAEGAMALPDGGAVKVRVEKAADGAPKTSVEAPDWVRIVR